MSDFDRAAAELARIDPLVRAALPDAAKAGADVVVPEMKMRAPTDSGKLRSSIDDRAGETGGNSASRIVFVGAHYGWFQENGTYKMSAQPFFRPAIDAKQGEVIETVKAEIKKAVKVALG